MDFCMVTFRSVTPAQRGETLLRRDGIQATVQRTPRTLAEQGCGYSLRLPCAQMQQAIEILRQKGISYRKTYHIREGNPMEVML